MQALLTQKNETYMFKEFLLILTPFIHSEIYKNLYILYYLFSSNTRICRSNKIGVTQDFYFLLVVIGLSLKSIKKHIIKHILQRMDSTRNYYFYIRIFNVIFVFISQFINW